MSVLAEIVREREEWANKNKFGNNFCGFLNKLELLALFGIAIFLFAQRLELF